MKIVPNTFLVTYFLRSEVDAATDGNKLAKYAYVTRDTTVIRAVNNLLRELKEAGKISKSSEVVIREVRVVAGV